MPIDPSKIKSAETNLILDEVTPSFIEDAQGNKIPVVVAVIPGEANQLNAFQSNGTLSTNDIEFQEDSLITDAPNPPLFKDATGKKLPIMALVGFDSSKNLVAPAAESVSLRPQQTAYVAKSGSDSTGTGSFSKPFASVQAAVDSLSTVTDHAAVYIMPGNYSGTTTITRNRTHLIGLGSPRSNVNSVSIGPVVFNVSSATSSVNNDNSSICNVLINGSASEHALRFTGSALVSLYLVNTYCYSNHAGKSGVYMDNTAAGGSRLYLFDSILNSSANATSSVSLHVVSGLVWQAVDTQIFNSSTSAGSRAIKLEGSSKMITGDRLSISGAGDFAVEVAGSTSTMALSNSLIEQVTANASGVLLAAGAQLTAVQNMFNVPSGTGRCVNGSLGSVLVHSLNTFAANNRFASAMGPGVVSLSTTPTLS